MPFTSLSFFTASITDASSSWSQISKWRMSVETSSQSLRSTNEFINKEKLISKKVLEFSKGRWQKKNFCQVTHNLNLSCHLGDKVLGLTLVALMILACMGLVEAWVWLMLGSSKLPFPFPLFGAHVPELPSALFRLAGLLGIFLVSRLLKLIRKLGKVIEF